jgi:hypothetical protein
MIKLEDYNFLDPEYVEELFYDYGIDCSKVTRSVRSYVYEDAVVMNWNTTIKEFELEAIRLATEHMFHCYCTPEFSSTDIIFRFKSTGQGVNVIAYMIGGHKEWDLKELRKEIREGRDTRSNVKIKTDKFIEEWEDE